MKRLFSRVLSVLAIFGLAVAAVPGVSLARSVPAYAGRAQQPSDYGCYAEWAGAMTNTCGHRNYFIIPLVVDGSWNGWYSPVVTAFGASYQNNVECAAYGVNKETTGLWGGAYGALPAFGASQDIATSTWAPPGGGVYVACVVSTGGRVNLVNW